LGTFGNKIRYDTASQLASMTYSLGGNPLGNLSYAYDNDGRRSSATGTFARTGLPLAMNTTAYNANNQLTTWGTANLFYDLNGNMTSDGTHSYTWDARNRLTQIDSGSTASFSYDASGRRTSKTVLSTQTGFFYDGANAVQELSGSTPTANLLGGGIDEVFQRTDSAGARSFLTDALGSTLALTDSTGTTQTSYTFEPFGNTTSTGSASTNSFAYTGRELDATGLYYYRARYYDQTNGRFLSEDPMRFGAGINFFRYVKNNAASLADPYGLMVQKCCRNTQVNWWVDFLSKLTGLKHCFIKTGSVIAGMGPAGSGALPACPMFTQTAVTDHSAEAISPGDCTNIPNVNEDCVNNGLKIGTPTGRWTPTNQCNSFVNDLLYNCSTCKTPNPQYPTPPHVGGFSNLDNR
jgi:RHS repeat-associated protein